MSTIATHHDLSALMQAMTSSMAADSAQSVLHAGQWEMLAPYLVPVKLSVSETLFAEGALDRNLYLVESGSLSVHYQDAKERIRLALVGPGAVLGEGAFFAHRPRRATVQASTPSRLWCLTALRFSELSNRQPALALALVVMAGQVLARRASDSRRRIAST
ncbi:cyclic nucleotide-binding domain-containing protein [Comamonas aquatilis]|uniref:Crp/Fnr family transcriptional regulator n=1 Tax=Comamonas aquatilis TaxID=1778406 RepID=UPI0039EF51B2